MEIRIANVRKEFGRFPALHDVSLDIRSGELIALLAFTALACGRPSREKAAAKRPPR